MANQLNEEGVFDPRGQDPLKYRLAQVKADSTVPDGDKLRALPGAEPLPERTPAPAPAAAAVEPAAPAFDPRGDNPVKYRLAQVKADPMAADGEALRTAPGPEPLPQRAPVGGLPNNVRPLTPPASPVQARLAQVQAEAIRPDADALRALPPNAPPEGRLPPGSVPPNPIRTLADVVPPDGQPLRREPTLGRTPAPAAGQGGIPEVRVLPDSAPPPAPGELSPRPTPGELPATPKNYAPPKASLAPTSTPASAPAASTGDLAGPPRASSIQAPSAPRLGGVPRGPGMAAAQAAAQAAPAGMVEPNWWQAGQAPKPGMRAPGTQYAGAIPPDEAAGRAAQARAQAPTRTPAPPAPATPPPAATTPPVSEAAAPAAGDAAPKAGAAPEAAPQAAAGAAEAAPKPGWGRQMVGGLGKWLGRAAAAVAPAVGLYEAAKAPRNEVGELAENIAGLDGGSRGGQMAGRALKFVDAAGNAVGVGIPHGVSYLLNESENPRYQTLFHADSKLGQTLNHILAPLAAPFRSVANSAKDWLAAPAEPTLSDLITGGKPSAPAPAKPAAAPAKTAAADPGAGRAEHGLNVAAARDAAGAESLAPDDLHEAVGWVESRHNPLAVSPKGAASEMQVMPATARDPGFGVTPARNNSPEELARVGHDYLNALHRRYGGDRDATLVAYNWGPGNADQWLKAGADPAALPPETRNYLARVNDRLQSGSSLAGAGYAVAVNRAPGSTSLAAYRRGAQVGGLERQLADSPVRHVQLSGPAEGVVATYQDGTQERFDPNALPPEVNAWLGTHATLSKLAAPASVDMIYGTQRLTASPTASGRYDYVPAAVHDAGATPAYRAARAQGLVDQMAPEAAKGRYRLDEVEAQHPEGPVLRGLAREVTSQIMAEKDPQKRLKMWNDAAGHKAGGEWVSFEHDTGQKDAVGQPIFKKDSINSQTGQLASELAARRANAAPAKKTLGPAVLQYLQDNIGNPQVVGLIESRYGIKASDYVSPDGKMVTAKAYADGGAVFSDDPLTQQLVGDRLPRSRSRRLDPASPLGEALLPPQVGMDFDRYGKSVIDGQMGMNLNRYGVTPMHDYLGNAQQVMADRAAAEQWVPSASSYDPLQPFAGPGRVYADPTDTGYANGGKVGGLIRGPGTGKSDSIPGVNVTTGAPVAVSNGEFIVPADTVQAVGVDKLNALVAATHAPVERYACGGPVGGLRRRAA